MRGALRGLDEYLTTEPDPIGRPPRVKQCPCGRAALCSREGCRPTPGGWADHCGLCHDRYDEYTRDEGAR